MDVFNLHGEEWDRTEDRDGWCSKDAWVGHRLGAELLGGMLSTMLMPEIVEYLDTGKVGTRDANGKRILLSQAGEAVEYWDGEA